jgi:hypothetical protein
VVNDIKTHRVIHFVIHGQEKSTFRRELKIIPLRVEGQRYVHMHAIPSLIAVLLMWTISAERVYTYRAWKNDADPSIPCQQLGYGQAQLVLSIDETNGALRGSIGGEDWNLTLGGSCQKSQCAFEATGTVGGQMWHYRYWGMFMHESIPVPAAVMVGGIVRVLAHGPNSPANETGSFYAVEGSTKSKSSSSSEAPTIAGTVVASVSLLVLFICGGAVLAVVLIRKKRNQNPFNPRDQWPARAPESPDLSNDSQLFQRAHC